MLHPEGAAGDLPGASGRDPAIMDQPPSHALHDVARRLRLGALLAAAAFALLALGWQAVRADGAPASPAASAPLDEAQLQRAQTLFRDTCASCHGPTGGGAGMPGLGLPPLDASSPTWQKSDVELILTIRNGAGVMPGVGRSWTDDEIALVLALIRSWWTPEQQAQHATLSGTAP